MNGMMERIGIMVVGCALYTGGGGAQNITASTILKMAEEEEVADHNLSPQMSNLLLLGLQRTFHRNQESVEWQTAASRRCKRWDSFINDNQSMYGHT